MFIFSESHVETHNYVHVRYMLVLAFPVNIIVYVLYIFVIHIIDILTQYESMRKA